MEYDRSDSFASDFEPNEILFGSKPKGKLSKAYRTKNCHHDHIPLNLKIKGNIFFLVLLAKLALFLETILFKSDKTKY